MLQKNLKHVISLIQIKLLVDNNLIWLKIVVWYALYVYFTDMVYLL
jgi:hypothetical protein